MTGKTRITPEKEIKHQLALQIIEQIEPKLAAASWEGFKKEGRGYVYFHKSLDVEHYAGNTFQATQGKSLLEGQIVYIAKDSYIWHEARRSEAAAGQEQEWAPFYELVDTYSPRNEFLLIVGMNYNDRATEHYFLREPKIPPYKTRANR
jgi:hypothetical protein